MVERSADCPLHLHAVLSVGVGVGVGCIQFVAALVPGRCVCQVQRGLPQGGRSLQSGRNREGACGSPKRPKGSETRGFMHARAPIV